jgi:hypothetical protein
LHHESAIIGCVSQPTRAEVAALLKRAQAQLRRAQELHADLQALMNRFGRLGLIDRRKVRRSKAPK